MQARVAEDVNVRQHLSDIVDHFVLCELRDDLEVASFASGIDRCLTKFVDRSRVEPSLYQVVNRDGLLALRREV